MLSIATLLIQPASGNFWCSRNGDVKVSLKIIQLILLIIGWCIPESIAQTSPALKTESSEKPKSLFSMGLGIQHGLIFAHSVDVENTRGARPTGIEAILGWQRNDPGTYALCHCYPRQGILMAYYDYDVDVLGKSGSLAYFLEPTYRLGDGFLFSFKGAGGLSYLSNPYDSINNPGNQSYSAPVSAYLLVGVGAWVKLSEKWWLNPTLNYQHISNGGTRKPNKGINWPTAGIALSYQPVSRPWYTGVKTTEKYWKEYSPRYDFVLLGTLRRGHDEAGNRVRHPLIGLGIQAGKQVGRLSMITLGAEAYHDDELRDELLLDEIDASPVKAGVMLGHEFLLGRFQFSQRLGVYVFDQTPYYDQIFHRWGLQYRINRHFSAGFNLLAHRQVAEFVDFRVAYTFQKKAD